MKQLNILVITSFLTLSAWAQAPQEDLEGLGKVERIQRLEKLVGELQAEVAKLKSGPGAMKGGSGASKSTYVQFSDLLQMKTELGGNVDREIAGLKITLSKTKSSIDSIQRSVDRIKDGSIKDIEFKIEALQKGFSALEKSLSAETAN